MERSTKGERRKRRGAERARGGPLDLFDGAAEGKYVIDAHIVFRAKSGIFRANKT